MTTSLRNITNQQILEFLVILGGCIFAMYAGNYIAEENYVPIAAVLGVLVAGTFFFKMGTDMYLMIPVCWGLTGSISLLPLPFNVRQLLIIAASVLFIAGYIFKIGYLYKTRIEMIDLWIYLNLCYLFTAFLRNPVGFAAIGGGARVGGKPYIEVLLGVVAYLILSRFRISPGFSRHLPLLMLGVAAFSSLAGAIGMFLPSVGLVLFHFYSAFAPADLMDPSGGADTVISAGETRLGFLLTLGGALPLYVVCRVNPVKLITPINFWWLVLYLCGVIMVLLSGFRNGIIVILLTTCVAAMIREKQAGMFKVVVAALTIALAGVLLSYSSFKLPFTFQRSLCFLPGNWDPAAVLDAKGSSEWRFEMWKMALTSDRYIRNKIFGDGFGFLREDFERGVDLMYGRTQLSETDVQQEMFLLDGDYHSGPVGAIRFVGVVGLMLFIPLLIMQAFYSYRVINAARGTPYEFLSMYLGIPSMIFPIGFIFLFGDYRTDFVMVLFNVGMMKMILFSIEDRTRKISLPTESLPNSVEKRANLALPILNG